MKRVAVIGIILLLLLTGCGTKEESTPSLQPSPQPPPPLTAVEIIEKCSERIGTLNYFHFELDQEGGGTPIAMGLEMSKASGDIARPDKLKIEISAIMLGMSLEVGVITVGETTYMTNPLTSQWEPLPNEFTAVKLFDPDTGITAIIGEITEATKLGEEEIAGALSYHLKGMIDSSVLRPITAGTAIEGVSIDTEVWIGKDDFLLRQIKMEGQITEGEEPGIIRTLSVSNFDQAVTIELPE